jgi:hypothetical protein
MMFSTNEAIKAEVAYRQAKVTEQFRRANSRRGRRSAGPKHAGSRRRG